MKLFKKSDLVVISAILLLSLGIWVWYKAYYSQTPVMAAIYYNSELVDTISLEGGRERDFSIGQNRNVVLRLYSDGSIAFVKSDCRDKLCIRSGKLRTVGQSAACLPNGVSVKIIRQKTSDDDLDIVIG
ncbi:MAG TPA: NusG domain II-containing protein [Candidatus Avimonas sp.]|nr:NusG domain II-containing protein [Clostridiales bacterium]HPU59043.1 NusG domain II-containing protein [Candidatus Avimonas sp.]